MPELPDVEVFHREGNGPRCETIKVSGQTAYYGQKDQEN